MTVVVKLAKAIFAANLAVMVRAMRFGISDALSRLTVTYRVVDPFQRNDPALRTIPEMDLSQVVTTSPSIVLDSSHHDRDGALPLEEQLALLAILCDRSPAVVLEIGTFFGTTTKAIALNRPGSTIHTVDLPPDYDATTGNDRLMPKDDLHLIESRDVGSAFRANPAFGNIRQHFGDTAVWNFAEAKDASFFFIDGSHTYEYVRNDTLKCLTASTGPSTLVWHDCSANHPGVVRWLSELVTRGLPVARIRNTTLAVMDYKPAAFADRLRRLA
jgi:hypothetical protein